MSNLVMRTGRRALLIGINHYLYLVSDKQLNGCVHDVKLMSKTLQEIFGFPAENITLVYDEGLSPTRDHIIQAMQDLLAKTQRDDIVVFHYSGHGSQVPDRDGDEPDGLDDTIVPCDSGRDVQHLNRDITDDEIRAWLFQMGQITPYITLIFDSCHSGSIGRDAFGARARSLPADERAATELPPPAFDLSVLSGEQGRSSISGWLPISNRYVLIAGCRDDESSYEMTTRTGGKATPHGTLTYFLVEELSKAKSGTTYQAVFDRIRSRVNRENTSQHPQMEGDINRVIFGVDHIEPMRYIRVENRRGSAVVLKGGLAHGLTVGSQWKIYPEGTLNTDADAAPIAMVEITSVDAVSSSAIILNEVRRGAVGQDCRAVLDTYHFDALRFGVVLGVPAGVDEPVTKLKQRIEESPLLTLTDDDDRADVKVYLVPARDQVRSGDPLPHLGPVTHPTWAAVGQDGKLAMPLCRASDASADANVVDNLDKLARFAHVYSLDNPDRSSQLAGQIELNLLCLLHDEWIPLPTDPTTGQMSIEEGVPLAFEVVNHYVRPVYVYLINLGLDKASVPIYPPEGSHESVAANGGRFTLGQRPGEDIIPYIPDAFPFAADPADSHPAGGEDTFKLLVTLAPLEQIHMLLQEGMRDAHSKGASDNPLEQVLALCATGRGSRNVAVSQRRAQSDWTVVQQTYFLTRQRH